MRLKWILVACALAILVSGCQRGEEAQTPVPQPQVQQEQSGTDPRAGEPGESQAESGTAPTMGDIRDAREQTAALPQSESPPPSDSAATQQAQTGSEAKQPAAEKRAESATPKPAAPAKAEKQQKGAALKPSSKESPAPPETVVLQSKNGNVTLTHKEHSQITDCKTCHRDAGGWKIDLDRDSGHKLCLGCHKEQGAGPTSCSGCHKK